MKTRNIMTFRAENGIRLSELAERLGIPEEKLVYAEKFNTVDRELADRIIREYSLPADYFDVTEEGAVPEIRVTERSYAYFILKSAVWYLLVGLATAVFTVLINLSPIKSSLAPIKAALSAVIIIASCILMDRHLRKKNACPRDFGEYKYILWAIPANIMLAFNLPVSAVGKAVSKSLDGTAEDLIVLALALIPIIVQVFVTAFMMKTLFRYRGAEKEKTMDILFLCSVLSSVLYYVINPIMFHAKGFMPWVRSGLLIGVAVLMAFGLIIGRRRKPKNNDIWLTTIPFIAILAPSVISILDSFI